MESKRWIALIITLTLLAASLACNLPVTGQATQAPAEAQPVEEATAEAAPAQSTQPAAEQNVQPPVSPPVEVQPTAAPTQAPPDLPIGLRQGLASLNSYRMKVEIIADGPTDKDKNHQSMLIEYDQKTDATHMHSENLTSSADDPEEERGSADTYKIGALSCSLSGDSSDETSEIEETNPLVKEMTETMPNLIDMTLYVEKPVPAGEETINGVKARHYTFTVSGLGKKSGGQATQSAGEYWVAVDGQYLVKYAVVMEMRSAPAGNTAAQVVHSEIRIELTDINQPITITMPPECK